MTTRRVIRPERRSDVNIRRATHRSANSAALTAANRTKTHSRDKSLYWVAKAIPITLATPVPAAAMMWRSSSDRRSLARAVYSLFIPSATTHTGELTSSSHTCVVQTWCGTGRSATWTRNVSATPARIAAASAYISRRFSANGSIDTSSDASRWWPRSLVSRIARVSLDSNASDTTVGRTNRFPLTTPPSRWIPSRREGSESFSSTSGRWKRETFSKKSLRIARVQVKISHPARFIARSGKMPADA